MTKAGELCVALESYKNVNEPTINNIFVCDAENIDEECKLCVPTGLRLTGLLQD